MLFRYFIFCLTLLTGIISLHAMEISLITSEPKDVTVSTSSPVLDNIIASVNDSDGSVYFATATLTDNQTTKALIGAAKNKRKVISILGRGSNSTAEKRLKKAGVKISNNNNVHANMTVTEDSSNNNTITMSSSRSSWNARTNNYEDGIHITNAPKNLIKKSKNIIKSIHENKENTTPAKSVDNTPEKTNIYSSRKYNLNQILIGRIQHAQKGEEITMASMNVNHQPVLDEIQNALERNVDITLSIHEPKPANYSPLKKIVAKGAKVFVHPRDSANPTSTFHEKGFARTSSTNPENNTFIMHTNNVTDQSANETNFAAIIPSKDLSENIISKFKKSIHTKRTLTFSDFLKKKEEKN